jgi:sugar lactone lactonase YvrE
MIAGRIFSPLPGGFCGFGLALLFSLPVSADEFPPGEFPAPPTERLDAEHSHDPIRINARPSMNRFGFPLVRPRRALFGPDGNLYLADWGAGEVVRVAPDGRPETLIQGLNEPSGLAFDRYGNLYIANHSQGLMGEGTIVRVAGNGDRTRFAVNLTGPTALAFDRMGFLFVASFETNSISMVTEDGVVTTFADNIPQPSALLFDTEGDLWVASSTEGEIYRITPEGRVELMAVGLESPSDMAFDQRGNLIVANYSGTQLTRVTPKGGVKAFAIVPKGTISHQFDDDDNIWLLNWDYRFLMKITRNLSVTCPHCGAKIPLLFRPDPEERVKPNHSL